MLPCGVRKFELSYKEILVDGKLHMFRGELIHQCSRGFGHTGNAHSCECGFKWSKKPHHKPKAVDNKIKADGVDVG